MHLLDERSFIQLNSKDKEYSLCIIKILDNQQRFDYYFLKGTSLPLVITE